MSKKDSGQVVTTYVYDAAGQLAAEYGGTTVAQGTQYLTADHLGSTRLVTGGTAECVDYLPFGEEITVSAGSPRLGVGCYTADAGLKQKFTGKERDSETKLDYFGARYLSGAQGRFTSPDSSFADQHPEDPQSWNMYAYVRNNPLKNTDPDGRDCQNGVVACGHYILGGVGAVVNAFSSGIINAPNRAIDAAISPFTSFRFGDVVPDAFRPSNEDQRQGVEAANAVMLVAPVAAEMGAVRATTATEEVSLITRNAARGTASETRVLNDLGVTKNTEPVVGTGGKSIPDFQTSTTVGEIKDVQRLSNTQQLRIQREAASQSGREHVVVTGTNTSVTPNVQKPPTRVIRRDDLGPQQ